MKKTICLAALLVSVCACKNEISDNLTMASSFSEFFAGYVQQGGSLRVEISSDDSVRTNYYDEWVDFYLDKQLDADDTDMAMGDGSDAETVKLLRDYKKRGVQHLEEMYQHQAAKYYKFESHLNGTDSVELIIATKELTDSLPKDCQKDNFRKNYSDYPESFHYLYTHKQNGENFDYLGYHRNEQVKGKKITNEEEIRQMFLDYIAKQKGTKEYPVRYLIDEGKDYNHGLISAGLPIVHLRRKNKERVLMEGTLYVLPGKGKEKIKNVEELRSMLKEFITTHYAERLTYIYSDNNFDLKQCDRVSTQLMELTICDERSCDSIANVFHVVVGNPDERDGLKILMQKPVNGFFFWPRREWMGIKSIHNDEIEWFPGYEGGYWPSLVNE